MVGVIEIRRLSKRYRTHWALRDLNLTIGTGMFGLLGPNGAGKTTLMRLLATLLRPTSGDALIYGLSLLERPDEIRKIIGYLPQFFQFYPQMTGYELLDYIAVMKGIRDGKLRRRQIREVLERVNLADRAHRKVKTYSGGMKQRLGIAQALLGDPQLIIVDEPTAGLDPEERVRFRNLLTALSARKTVILSTHIVADIENTCRQVAVLNRGELVLAGSLDDLQGCAEGKVWEIRTTEAELPSLAPLQVVSTRGSERDVVCRVIADRRPSPEAVPVAPTLEEGYLVLIGGKGGRRE